MQARVRARRLRLTQEKLQKRVDDDEDDNEEEKRGMEELEIERKPKSPLKKYDSWDGENVKGCASKKHDAVYAYSYQVGQLLFIIVLKYMKIIFFSEKYIT